MIYEAHVTRPDDDPPGPARRHPRHVRRHRRTRRSSSTCTSSASRRSSSCRCTSSCRTTTSSSAGCRTTGATTPSASSRRTTPTPPAASAASRCWSSRRWSASCTPPASRSSSTWSTTTPPRATRWARRCRSAASTTRRTTGWSTDRPEHYYDTTGTGNTLLMRHPHVLQLIMDSLRYWVLEMHVDGFRFDLASTLARQFHEVDRLSAFFDLVQQDPVISPGQADRRAVGRRRGRLPGRQLPAAVDRVERQVPRHRPRLLARRAGDPGGVRLPAHRLGRPLPGGRPPPARVHQLRHRARRLHPDRPGVVQREAQRGQRRGQQRRREPQPVLELRRRGRRPTTSRCSPCASGRSATSSPRCSCRRACRCCCTATSWAARRSGNNNVYCQDNPIAWVDWDDARDNWALTDFTGSA